VVLFLAGPSSKFNYQTRLSQFVKFATIFQCTFLLLEHRFYGISLPTGSAPFSTSNLKYLTVEQALLDAQAFATAFQAQYMPAGTKWILAGEAYSASLAAWYTQRFLGGTPTGINAQFVGSVASSAALEARTDFRDFFLDFEPASTNLTGANNCAATIRAGTSAIQALLAAPGGAGRTTVAQLFGACETQIAPEDDFFFKWAVSEVIASSMELNTPPVWSLNRTCAAALNGSTAGPTAAAASVQRAFDFNMNFQYQLCLEVCNGTSTLDRVREVVFRPPVKQRSDSAGSCVSFDESDWLKSLSSDDANPQRAWWWQRCTELGQFHATSDGHNDSDDNIGAQSDPAPSSVFFDDIDIDKVRRMFLLWRRCQMSPSSTPMHGQALCAM
jgi:hypothetical protein